MKFTCETALSETGKTSLGRLLERASPQHETAHLVSTRHRTGFILRSAIDSPLQTGYRARDAVSLAVALWGQCRNYLDLRQQRRRAVLGLLAHHYTRLNLSYGKELFH